MVELPENCRDASSEPYKKPNTITCEISQIEAKKHTRIHNEK